MRSTNSIFPVFVVRNFVAKKYSSYVFLKMMDSENVMKKSYE